MTDTSNFGYAADLEGAEIISAQDTRLAETLAAAYDPLSENCGAEEITFSRESSEKENFSLIVLGGKPLVSGSYWFGLTHNSTLIRVEFDADKNILRHIDGSNPLVTYPVPSDLRTSQWYWISKMIEDSPGV